MDIFAGTIDSGTQLSKELWSYKVQLDPAVKWAPGAHVHIGLPGFRDGDTPNKALVRHMSAASLTADGYLEFITRVPETPSVFKATLRSLHAGDRVSVFKIGSVLHLEDQAPMVFLSMGVGIAAYYPLWRLQAAKQAESVKQANGDVAKQIVVSLQVGKADETALKDRAEAINADIDYRWAVGRKDYGDGLKAILADETLHDKAVFTVVGSYAFVQDSIRSLLASGISAERIIVDMAPPKRETLFASL